MTPAVCCGRASVLRQASSSGGRPPAPALPGSVERERSTSSISVSFATSFCEHDACGCGCGCAMAYAWGSQRRQRRRWALARPSSQAAPSYITPKPRPSYTCTYLQALLGVGGGAPAPPEDQVDRVLQNLGHDSPGLAWLAGLSVCVWRVRGKGKQGKGASIEEARRASWRFVRFSAAARDGSWIDRDQATQRRCGNRSTNRSTPALFPLCTIIACDGRIEIARGQGVADDVPHTHSHTFAETSRSSRGVDGLPLD